MPKRKAETQEQEPKTPTSTTGAIKRPKVRGPYDRVRVFSKNEKPSMTEQSHAKNCDLHIIMNRYTKTGELPSGFHRGPGEYIDAPDQEQDFTFTQQKMAEFRSAYYNLPESEQAKYNDPLDYARDVLSQLEQKERAEQPQETTSAPADTEAVAEDAEGMSEASQSS